MNKLLRLAGRLATLGVVVAAIWAIINHQRVVDYITVWYTQTPASVIGLVERAGMNQQGVFTYRATQPELAQASSFNKACAKQEEASAILGCYVRDRIYVYDITDERLDGVREVTATHETLHAIWARLPGKERERLGKLLDEAYAQNQNEQLAERMRYYDRTEPGQRHNELHSIMGTEFATLPRELEAYYSRYFHNRQQVVQLHHQYERKFANLRGSMTQLKGQLTELAARVRQQRAQYQVQLDALNHDIEVFNTEARSGNMDRASYAAQRQQLSERRNQLERVRADINDQVATYEQIRQRYNTHVHESNSLQQALDSSSSLSQPARVQ